MPNIPVHPINLYTELTGKSAISMTYAHLIILFEWSYIFKDRVPNTTLQVSPSDGHAINLEKLKALLTRIMDTDYERAHYQIS